MLKDLRKKLTDQAYLKYLPLLEKYHSFEIESILKRYNSDVRDYRKRENKPREILRQVISPKNSDSESEYLTDNEADFKNRW
jgi:hypothetical protein